MNADVMWGAVFDLDGLLVDSEPLQAQAFNVALQRYDVFLDEDDFAALVGFETIDNFRTLRRRYNLPETAEELLARKNRAYHEIVPLKMQATPGARELVEALFHARVPLAVASSSPRIDVLLSLNSVGLAQPFGTVVTADDVERTKPSPDLYLEACRSLGLPPGRCVAFEDSGAGVEAATNAGLACFAVPHAYTRDHDFSKAVAVLDSLHEISLERLKSMFS